jgi:hypothetical protein
MDPFWQRLCIWAGPLSLLCAMTGLSFTGFSLPMSSEFKPEQVARFYADHRAGIRVAGCFFLFCSAFMMIFAAAISAQLQRIEGKVTPWVFVQLIGGVMGNVPLALTGIIWSVAAFRPERPPEVLQAINDLAMFILELPAPTAAIQFLGIIFVVLGDRSANPVFPKWVAYLNIIVAILFLPGVAGGVLVDWKSMGWDGFLAYTMPSMALSSWVILMFIALFRATRREV